MLVRIKYRLLLIFCGFMFRLAICNYYRFVIASWVRYKLKPTQENRTQYLVRKHKVDEWIREL